MDFKKYKQYLNSDYNCKMICGLKDATPHESYELIDSYLHHSAGMFRPMTLSILAFDESAGDIGDCVETDTSEADYMRIFLGKKPEWKPVNVFLYSGGVLIYYYRFDNEGKVKAWTSVLVSAPPQLMFMISFDEDNNLPAESYIVTLGKDSGKSSVFYEYLQNGHRLYSSLLGEDERGTFEIITENE